MLCIIHAYIPLPFMACRYSYEAPLASGWSNSAKMVQSLPQLIENDQIELTMKELRRARFGSDAYFLLEYNIIIICCPQWTG